ncbi:hypothetical protein ACH0CA_01440 [Kytococcus sedentarius]|uniref:hypothetical protein n=1 Tax=Kytococcus sedentarius TaxID=1276 RepID=UPI00387A814B
MEFFDVTPARVLAVHPGAKDGAWVAALLDLAEERLLAEVPDLPQRVDSGKVRLGLVEGVLIDMVGRVAGRPASAYESVQASAGAFQFSGKSAPGGDQVRVLPSDLKHLLPRGRSGGRSVRMSMGW